MQDPTEHWLVVNTNVVEGTNLPAWVTDETYCLLLVWEPENKTDFRASTQRYGGNLTCQLLAGNTVRQISKMDKNSEVGINVAIAISDEGLACCAMGVTIPWKYLY